MGEPIQHVSGSSRYFIVSEVQLSMSLQKCIIFSPISAIFCQFSTRILKWFYLGKRGLAYLDFCNITVMTHSLNEKSFTSAKRHPHFDEKLSCLDNAQVTHFNR